jgi:hypothetical protein
MKNNTSVLTRPNQPRQVPVYFIGLAGGQILYARVAITGRNKTTLDAAAKELGHNLLALEPMCWIPKLANCRVF